LKLFYKDPFDQKNPRGSVYEDNGRYYAVRFEERDGQFRMDSVVPLAGHDRRGAAQNYLLNKDLSGSAKPFLDRLMHDVAWLETQVMDYKGYLVNLAKGKSEADVAQFRAEAE